MVHKRWITLATGATMLFHGFLFLTAAVVGLIGFGTYASYEARATNQRVRPQVVWPTKTEVVDDQQLGAVMYATVDGKALQLPIAKVTYDVDVRGDLVHVFVKQRFENPSQSVMDANYEFPIDPDAAVHKMTMIVGNRRVEAQIQRKAEAQATFKAAKEEGKSAALLIQKRPNVFSQNIANVPVGQAIEVELEYVQAIRKFDGKYELGLPLVVGERFNPDMSKNTLGDTTFGAIGYKPVIEGVGVEINVRIDGDLPVEDVESSSHAILLNPLSPSDLRLSLASEAIPNRHFELSWRYDTSEPAAAIISSWDANHGIGHASILIEAPKNAPEKVQAREMVFLLDCSGSMGGAPMDTSKAFMRAALAALRPTDTFRIIRFSEASSELSDRPLLATRYNVNRGLAYVESLNGTGGTQMTEGILRALDEPGSPDSLRLVTFLTDGFIGNDFEVLRLIDEKVGNSRLFAIGVGQGVNTYLLNEVGSHGRGFTRYINPKTEDLDMAAEELARRLQSPVLTDIEVNSDGKLASVYPMRVPDLFAGQSIRIIGTYAQSGPTNITITGMSGGKRVSIPVQGQFSATDTRGTALRNVWARTRVHQLMQDMLADPRSRSTKASDEELQESITQMGLEYGLMTQWTAFVAVDVTPELPEYAMLETKPAPSMFIPEFGAAPEPATLGGLLVLICGGVASRRKKRASQRAE